MLYLVYMFCLVLFLVSGVGYSSIDWAQLSRLYLYLRTETESSLRNVFK
jgi:uncharacterized membrane protein (Fun14 family)